MGAAVYGVISAPAPTWGRERHDELDAGGLDTVLDALRTHVAANDEARTYGAAGFLDFRAAAEGAKVRGGPRSSPWRV